MREFVVWKATNAQTTRTVMCITMTVPRSSCISAFSSPSERARHCSASRFCWVGAHGQAVIPSSQLGRNRYSPGNTAWSLSSGKRDKVLVGTASRWTGLSWLGMVGLTRIYHLTWGIVKICLCLETELGQQGELFSNDSLCETLTPLNS